MRISMAVVVLCLCVKANALTFHCDETCSAQVSNSVACALSAWNYAIDNTLDIEPGPSPADIEVSITSDPIIGCSDVSCGVHLAGKTWFSSPNHAFILLEDIYAVDFIILHEVGHALGLGHSKDPNAVMYYQPNNSPFLTQSDVDSIRLRYGFSPKTFIFNATIKFHKVQVCAPDNGAHWLFGDGDEGVLFKDRTIGSRIIHRYAARGTYTITLFTNGIVYKRDVTIGPHQK